MTHSSAAVQGGIGLGTYNYLKCWLCSLHGQDVLRVIFDWSRRGCVSDIKKDLFQISGYSNKLYRSEFDKTQRALIESGDSKAFDVSLLFLLLQKISELPNRTSSEWGRRTSNPNSLPMLIYTIKNKRNIFAHSKGHMTTNDMHLEIDGMLDTFIKALKKAGHMYMKHITEVEKEVLKISSEIKNIRLSMLPSNTIGEYQKEVYKQKVNVLVEESCLELTNAYIDLTTISHTPLKWCYVESRPVVDVFVEPKITHEKMTMLYNQISDYNSRVYTKEMLSTSINGIKPPSLIFIKGQTGMGKTSLMKYFISNWLDKTSAITGLDEFDLLFYLNCMGNNQSSLSDVISKCIPNTMAKFQHNEIKTLIASLKVLFIVDNIECCDLQMADLFNINSKNFRYLVTSTKDSSGNLSKIMLDSRALKLELYGIDLSTVEEFIDVVMSKIYDITSSSAESLKFSFSDFTNLIDDNTLSLLHSPEVLVHLCWYFNSIENNYVSKLTRTLIVIATNQTILKKLQEKLQFNDDSIEHFQKLDILINEIGQVAIHNINNCHSLRSNDISKFLSNCSELFSKSCNFIADEVFILQQPKCGLGRKTIKFRSFLLQCFYTAKFIVEKLLPDDPKDFQIKIFSYFNINPDNEKQICSTSFADVAAFLIGIIHIENYPTCENNINVILSILHNFYKFYEITDWLEIIRESNCDPEIMNKINKSYVRKHWYIEDDHICKEFIEVLKSSYLEDITLVTCTNPENYILLLEALSILCFLSKNRTITVSLLIYYHFWTEKNSTSDKYLEIFHKLENDCNIEVFSGKLSIQGISMLPNTLTKLSLHITYDLIPALNAALTSCDELRLLYLNFDVCPNTNATDVAPIRVQKKVFLAVDLWNLAPLNIKWMANIVKNLNTSYGRLVLRRTAFEYHDAKTWIKSLYENKVFISSFVIGSINQIEPMQEKQLNSIIGRNATFKWIYI